MDLAERLLAIEEIKQLKARYFRAVDTKDAALLAEIFCHDAEFNMGGGANLKPTPEQVKIVTGADAICHALLTGLDGSKVSVHQGFGHEVEIVSPTHGRRQGRVRAPRPGPLS